MSGSRKCTIVAQHGYVLGPKALNIVGQDLQLLLLYSADYLIASDKNESDLIT
jgi:hypothetical protein